MYSISSFIYLNKINNLSCFFEDLCHFRKWYKMRNSGLGTFEYQIPWMVFGCVDFLDDWLKPEMLVFEYGSGGSTLFFASRVKNVLSIDHNPQWFKIIKETIEQKNIKNIEYNLMEPIIDSDFDKKNYLNPNHFLSAGEEFSGKNFSTYVKAIDKFNDDFFDLVVIDGRARQSCISQAKTKVRKGGILLLDNADREYYLTLNLELKNSSKWKRKDYAGHFPFCSASVLEITSVFTKLY